MKKLFLLVFVLILTIQTVFAIGISPALIRMDFQSNYEETITFRTEVRSNTVVTLDGELKDYLTLVENNIPVDGTFRVKLALPEYLETPGVNAGYIELMEGTPDGGTVAAVAAIRTPIYVRVPYPGIYAESQLRVRDLNNNETANFYIVTKNLGKNPILNAKATLEIKDINDNTVEKFTTGEEVIDLGEEQQFEFILDGSKLTPGSYQAIGVVTYADQQKKLTDRFRVGELKIDITEYTKRVPNEEIVPFNLNVKSGWNKKINNIFGEVTIYNNSYEISHFKTVSFDLNPWEDKAIQTFWSKGHIGPGEYPMDLVLFYDGENTVVNGVLEVFDETAPEKQSLTSFLSFTNILIIAVALLIIINILIVLKKKRDRNEKK